MIALIEKICFLCFTFLCMNLHAQAKNEAFEVKISGSGDQNLVFIPGLASSGKVFAETRSEFEGNFSIYTFTLAGFAGVPPMENPSFETWKKVIVDYLKDNKVEKPIIIGHSMGGALAMAIAADYPELPKKIVVIDALPFLSGLNPKFDPEKETDCSAMVKRITAMDDEQFRQTQQRNIQFMVADSSKQDLVLRWSLNSDRKTVAKILCNYLKLDLRKKIGKITAPSLVLLEPYFKNASSTIDAQFANLKPLTLKYAPKGRHFLMYGAKKWFMEQLQHFIYPQQ